MSHAGPVEEWAGARQMHMHAYADLELWWSDVL